MSAIRVRRAVEAIAKATAPQLPHLAKYPATVVTQASDGTVEVNIDDSTMPPEVAPIRVAIPGLTVKVSAGTRVQIGYEGGDPSKPVAELWDAEGDEADEVRLAVGQPADEHVLTTEALFNILNNIFIQIGIQNPGPITGAGLAALAMPILSAAAAAAGTTPQLPEVGAALVQGFFLAPPKLPGAPIYGQVFPGLGARAFLTG